jgi:hypothetical protein
LTAELDKQAKLEEEAFLNAALAEADGPLDPEALK